MNYADAPACREPVFRLANGGDFGNICVVQFGQRCITNNLQKLQWYNNNDTTYMNGYTVNRYEGWFYVTAENAGKAWTFRSNYDDRAALWIDGVDSGLTGDSNNTLSTVLAFTNPAADYLADVGAITVALMGDYFGFSIIVAQNLIA